MLFTFTILSLLMIETIISQPDCEQDDIIQHAEKRLRCGAWDRGQYTFTCTSTKSSSCPKIPGPSNVFYGSHPGYIDRKKVMVCIWKRQCNPVCPLDKLKPSLSAKEFLCKLNNGQNDCPEPGQRYNVRLLPGRLCSYLKRSDAAAHIAIDNNINMGNFCFAIGSRFGVKY